MLSENLGNDWFVGSEGQDGAVHVLGEALKGGHRIIASAEVTLLSGQDPRVLMPTRLGYHLEGQAPS